MKKTDYNTLYREPKTTFGSNEFSNAYMTYLSEKSDFDSMVAASGWHLFQYISFDNPAGSAVDEMVFMLYNEKTGWYFFTGLPPLRSKLEEHNESVKVEFGFQFNVKEISGPVGFIAFEELMMDRLSTVLTKQVTRTHTYELFDATFGIHEYTESTSNPLLVFTRMVYKELKNLFYGNMSPSVSALQGISFDIVPEDPVPVPIDYNKVEPSQLNRRPLAMLGEDTTIQPIIRYDSSTWPVLVDGYTSYYSNIGFYLPNNLVFMPFEWQREFGKLFPNIIPSWLLVGYSTDALQGIIYANTVANLAERGFGVCLYPAYQFVAFGRENDVSYYKRPSVITYDWIGDQRKPRHEVVFANKLYHLEDFNERWNAEWEDIFYRVKDMRGDIAEAKRKAQST